MAKKDPKYIRVFLSSPGDVLEERRIVKHEIDKLRDEPLLRGTIVECIAWDDPNAPVMDATKTPQEAINEGLPMPADCDIVIVIMWSRLGTPLDVEHHGVKANGDPYHSGTEWEYLNGINAATRNRRQLPRVIVYRRTEKRAFDADSPDFKDQVKQFQLVEDFFAQFRDPATGAFRRGYYEYADVQTFEQNFLIDLKRMIVTIWAIPPDWVWWSRRLIPALLALLIIIGGGVALWSETLRRDAMSPMVSFAAQSAVLGTDDLERNVNAFSLDVHEVSIRQYRLCVQARACTPPDEPSYSNDYNNAQGSQADVPVTWVRPDQAAGYCRWLGRRLPTSREWEFAARGAENRLYPWGNQHPEPGMGRVNLRIDTDAQWNRALVRVDDPNYENGRTPQGVWHMLGNVREWTSSPTSCGINCGVVWDGISKLEDGLVLRDRGYLTGDLDVARWTELNDWNTWAETVTPAETNEAYADIGFRCAAA
jgi:hypothetical protein